MTTRKVFHTPEVYQLYVKFRGTWHYVGIKQIRRTYKPLRNSAGKSLEPKGDTLEQVFNILYGKKK